MKAKKTTTKTEPVPPTAPKILAMSPKAFSRLARAHVSDGWSIFATDVAEPFALDCDEIAGRAGTYELRDEDGITQGSCTVTEESASAPGANVGADKMLASSASSATAIAVDGLRTALHDARSLLREREERLRAVEKANDEITESLVKLTMETASLRGGSNLADAVQTVSGAALGIGAQILGARWLDEFNRRCSAALAAGQWTKADVAVIQRLAESKEFRAADLTLATQFAHLSEVGGDE